MDIEELMSIKFENAGHILPLIHQLEGEEPDKRKKEWRQWQEKINFLFDKYNKTVEFPAFKLIK